MQHFDTHEDVEGMQPCRKTTTVEAKQMEEDFEVETLEGTMKGEAGDYLMRGADGELYPCDEGIFEETYEWAEAPEEREKAVEYHINRLLREWSVYEPSRIEISIEHQAYDIYRVELQDDGGFSYDRLWDPEEDTIRRLSERLARKWLQKVGFYI